ncbi:MAG: peptidase M14 [Ignavibacteriales bacterium CG_4_9_14_3_um_filter_34_10]|nr:MAG: peptidase M14 [Ignavibacteriales bacterium CG_4_9_14_3_um_filter_34_10]
MKKLILFLLLTITGITLAQEFNSERLYDSYDSYRDLSIIRKKFTHQELMVSLEKFRSNEKYNFKKIGKSMENKEIWMVTIGHGNTHILAWSQMHGDESTATMALLDILNFFSANDQFDDLRNRILENVTIHLIPMLNPDGAGKFKRRNHLDIDLNRDAARLQFPESKILKSVRDSINPKFGFNLHDQSTRYTVGESYKSAALSFLAPAFNYEKDINDVRSRGMLVISNIFTEVSRFIPGHMAKYNDDFEPRAFGDNMMKWGTSSILIESGGWKNNFDKQFIRKLNFISLLVGFQSIAFEYYQNADIEVYQNIPENKTKLFDLLLRNLTAVIDSKKYIIDLGINYSETERENKNGYYFRGRIDDIGDLSTFFGYDEFDFTGSTIQPGEVYNKNSFSKTDLQSANFDSLYSKGFTAILSNVTGKFTDFPINLVANEEKYKPEFAIGSLADFKIIKNNKVQYLLINGFLYDIKAASGKVPNGIIVR